MGSSVSNSASEHSGCRLATKEDLVNRKIQSPDEIRTSPDGSFYDRIRLDSIRKLREGLGINGDDYHHDFDVILEQTNKNSGIISLIKDAFQRCLKHANKFITP